MNAIDLLLSAIQRGVLLGSKNFKSIFAGEILSGRDDPQFEQNRLVLFEELKDLILGEGDRRRLDRLREVAYLKTFGEIPQHDLRACIADDFELIGKASVGLPESAFAAALLGSYLIGNIPHGTIAPSAKPLLSLIESMRLQVIEGRQEMNNGITMRLGYEELVKCVHNILQPDESGCTSEEIDRQLLDFCINCPDPSAAMDVVIETREPLTAEEMVDKALAMPLREIESVPESELPPYHALRFMKLER